MAWADAVGLSRKTTAVFTMATASKRDHGACAPAQMSSSPGFFSSLPTFFYFRFQFVFSRVLAERRERLAARFYNVPLFFETRRALHERFEVTLI
jgi:hypothetical protein